ncbi:MAG: MFS transporter [Candidatus Adiutrix sp.]|nr:MFS transporter [Candidatus Adiutrix sp.]
MNSRAADAKRAREAKKSTAAAAFGTFLEYYDFSCYGYVAAMLSSRFFPSDNPTVSLLATMAVFGSAFVVRPFGGIFFGLIGDKFGRKASLLITVILMGAISSCIGVLPTYEQIGIMAPVLLVIFRLLQGFSAGGEIGGAASYIREWAPPERRSLYISFIPSIAVLGKAAAAGAAALAASLFVDQNSDWAWRAPFLLALPLMLGCLYLRLKIEDSPEFSQLAKSGGLSKAPMKELFSTYLASVSKLFCCSLAQNIGTYIGTVYVAVYMRMFLNMPAASVGLTVLIAITCAALLIPFFGSLTDKIGAKKMLAAAYICYIILSYPMYKLMGQGSLGLTIFALVVTMIPYTLCQAGSYAMYPELLPTRVRSTGVSFAHSLGAVVGGGLMPYAVTLLIDKTGDIMFPTYLLILTGILGLANLAGIKYADPGDTRKFK